MSDPLSITDPAALPEPDRRTDVAVNRTRLRVWEWGEVDAPVVICAHGAHDHGRMWDQLAPAIASLGYQVWAPDSRGHGASGRLGSGHVWNAATLDLACLARRAGHRVGLIGHSFGGGQVFSVAATMPELVAWAVNIDGIGPPVEAFDDPPLAEFAVRCLDGIDRVVGRGARAYPSLGDLVERRAAVNGRVPRSWVEHLVRHGHAEVGDGGVAFATDPLFGAGVPDGFTVEHGLADLGAIEAPTLVLTGSEPDTWSELSADEIARRVAMLRDGRHVEIDGAGHYVHVEQPRSTFAAIAAFVDEIDGRARHTPLPPAAAGGAGSGPTAPEGAVTGALSSVDDLPPIDGTGDRIVVLHELGAPDGGRPWRDATSAWTGRLDAPDLPGHGGSPAPVGGHYEAVDVPFMVHRLFPNGGEGRRVVVGVGTSGWTALILGLAGRASAVVLVDGLGGPWVEPAVAMSAVRRFRRRILDSPDGTSEPRRPFDQRLRTPPHLLVGRADIEEAIATLPVPLLVLESPLSPTPTADAIAVAGPLLTSVPSTDPRAVFPVLTGWLSDVGFAGASSSG